MMYVTPRCSWNVSTMPLQIKENINKKLQRQFIFQSILTTHIRAHTPNKMSNVTLLLCPFYPWAQPKLMPGIDALSFHMQVFVCVWLNVRLKHSKWEPSWPAKHQNTMLYCKRNMLIGLHVSCTLCWGMKYFSTRARRKKKERNKEADRDHLYKTSRGTEMLRAFLLLLHLQYLTSCDQQQYIFTLSPVQVGTLL